MFSLLRRRNFLLLWAAGLISDTGDWVLFVALPITVYRITHSALATSGVLASLLIPTILLGSVAGVFVDRWDHKRILVLTNLGLGVGLLPLLLVHSAGDVWLVYLVALVQACLSAFFQPTQSAALPRLVGGDDLIAANAIGSFSSNAARLVGPSLGGVVAAATGLAGVTLIDAATFLTAAGAISLIVLPRRDRQAPPMGAGSAWTQMYHEWREGLHIIRDSRPLNRLVPALSLTGLGEGVFGVMFVIWIRTVIRGGALQLGWFMTAQAIGGLLGGLVLGTIASRLAPAILVGLGSLLFALLDVALFTYPVFVNVLWPGLAIIILVGIPGAASGAGMTAWIQSTAPEETRGRIFGTIATTSALMMLVGTAIAGTIGNRAGPVALLNIFQGGSYLVVGALVLSLAVTGGVGYARRVLNAS